MTAAQKKKAAKAAKEAEEKAALEAANASAATTQEGTVEESDPTEGETPSEVTTTIEEIAGGGEPGPDEQIGDSGLPPVALKAIEDAIETPALPSVLVRVKGQPIAEDSGKYGKGEIFSASPERAAALGHLVELVTDQATPGNWLDPRSGPPEN